MFSTLSMLGVCAVCTVCIVMKLCMYICMYVCMHLLHELYDGVLLGEGEVLEEEVAANGSSDERRLFLALGARGAVRLRIHCIHTYIHTYILTYIHTLQMKLSRIPVVGIDK